jgi:hypothetical protein
VRTPDVETAEQSQEDGAECEAGKNDFVEMGSVSEETKGSNFGRFYDGGFGLFG